MSARRSWFDVVMPRVDLRENQPLDASEFAVHLDHVRLGRPHVAADYLDPARFFERTYLTHGLLDLTAQVARRLNGLRVETSAIFNLTTEFGGGKTHALTTVFHLARHGEACTRWRGVEAILQQAHVAAIPTAATAVFVGTEFSVLNGRGAPGEPTRRTPWGEIAWQLGRSPVEQRELFSAIARHDELGLAPAGDDIRRMLPNGPTLILMDELLNYLSSGRQLGRRDQFFNFLQNLCEEARARDNLVLCLSIPRADLEMNPDDRRDQEAIQKLCDRLGKAVRMTADQDLPEILRRRLFEWEGLPPAAEATLAASADWAAQHAHELAGIDRETIHQRFRACYPFHPTVISLFERKWAALPHFQRTRGALRLLALWIAHNFQSAQRPFTAEPLITLGLAPWDQPQFRAAILEQLGAAELEAVITTDIATLFNSNGNDISAAHAEQLDRDASTAIRAVRLHRQVASTVFFESCGGQNDHPIDASLAEIKTAVGGPDVHLTDIETVLAGLTSRCFFLHGERDQFHFGLAPNLNQWLVARRGNVKEAAITQRIRQRTADLFRHHSIDASKHIERVFFPERPHDVREVPRLTLVVLSPEHVAETASTLTFIEHILRSTGQKDRTLKTALLFAVAQPGERLTNAAREVLTWEEIHSDPTTVRRLNDSQRAALERQMHAARRELEEAIFGAYRHLYLLGKDNALRHLDLGGITSTSASSFIEIYLQRLGSHGGLDVIVDTIPARKLLTCWPAAQTHWSTQSVRDAFYASPLLPRVVNPTVIQRAIADGLRQGVLRLAIRDAQGELRLQSDMSSCVPSDIEFTEAHVLLPASHTDAALTSRPMPRTEQPRADAATPLSTGDLQTLSWQGVVPPQQWMTFYSKILSRLVTTPGMQIEVRFAAPVHPAHLAAKLHDVQAGLRDLGLHADVSTD